MASSARLVLLLTISMSLMEVTESAPAHRGRGGWTLNSAGYLLGPVLQLPSKAVQGRSRDSALEILDLWKAIGGTAERIPGDFQTLPFQDGLPYSHPPRMVKRTLVETFDKPDTGGLRMLRKKVPKRGRQPEVIKT